MLGVTTGYVNDLGTLLAPVLSRGRLLPPIRRDARRSFPFLTLKRKQRSYRRVHKEACADPEIV